MIAPLRNKKINILCILCVILISTVVTSTVHTMTLAARTVKKYKKSTPKIYMSPYFQCRKDHPNGGLQCSKRLFGAQEDEFTSILKNCCNSAPAVRFLICEFVNRGNTTKVAESLKLHTALFDTKELEALKDIANYKYERSQDWKYIEIFQLLDNYKPKVENRRL